MEDLILTDSEKQVILKLREKEKEKKRRQYTDVHIIKTAGEYVEWLLENNRFSSFSTFIAEFNYTFDPDKTINLDASLVYEMVSNILDYVRVGNHIVLKRGIEK